MDNKDIHITEASACFVDDDYINNLKEINESYFIIRNNKLGFELQYEWNSKTWPWLCIWTEHYGTNYKPWNGNERCRGFELSTKPFPIPSLHDQLPQNEIKKHPYNNNINLWNNKPIDFVLPHNGKIQTFALRWSKIN